MLNSSTENGRIKGLVYLQIYRQHYEAARALHLTLDKFVYWYERANHNSTEAPSLGKVGTRCAASLKHILMALTLLSLDIYHEPTDGVV